MSTPGRLVVVGASLAGLRACEAARRLGHSGELVLVGAEGHLPYDRPPLSKAFLDDSTDADAVPWLPGAATLSSELHVDLKLGHPATSLDLSARSIATGAAEIDFDALLIACGATPRTLPGTEGIAGVCALRTVDEARQVRSALDAGARTVIVGAGFIGAEVASAARRRDLPVTIAEAALTPLLRSVGAVAGAALERLHTQHGTDIRCGVTVDHVEARDDGRVGGVVLSDGTSLPADLVVVGIGASPATEWIQGSGLPLSDGVLCDDTLKAADAVYAAGDVARWRSVDFDEYLRPEHWTNASEMAAHAVRNLLAPDAATSYRHIPYFWSDWYGSRIQFAGVPRGEPEVVSGDWDAPAFAALYRDGDRVVGALTLDRRSDIMKYRALIARGASWEDGLTLARERNERR